jgi:hypothetical protein
VALGGEVGHGYLKKWPESQARSLSKNHLTHRPGAIERLILIGKTPETDKRLPRLWQAQSPRAILCATFNLGGMLR